MGVIGCRIFLSCGNTIKGILYLNCCLNSTVLRKKFAPGIASDPMLYPLASAKTEVLGLGNRRFFLPIFIF